MSVLKTYDVVIIGGGAAGCTTAYMLRREGITVALLDKGPIAREASWASAGMIGPCACTDRDPWFLAATTLSHQMYHALDHELFELTGRRIGLGGEGEIVYVDREEDLNELDEKVRIQKEADVDILVMDGTTARQREPALPETTLKAACKPKGRFLDARTYTQIIGQAARQLGATVYEGEPVTGLVRQTDRVTGVRLGNDEIHAGTVINTAGAWAGKIDPALSHPVKPLHGQIMSVQGPMCGLRHNVSQAVEWGYCTPRADGRVVVGATHENFGYRKKQTPDGMTHICGIARRVLPVLAEQPILEIWSGLRPQTPDGLPTIGTDPRAGNGYLWGAGHASSGMMQMPATAAVLCDLVTEKDPRLTIDQLSVERYLDDRPVKTRDLWHRFVQV